MKAAIFLFLSSILLSCQDKTTSSKKSINKIEANDTKKEILKTIITENKTTEIDSFDLNKVEVMLEKDIFFNGKLTRYFTLKDFEKNFGKPDSIVLMSKIEPCNYVFENEDGSKDMEDTYLYKDGSSFENSKNDVAVNEFRFTKKNFVKFKNIILNSETTKEDLKKYFPYAMEYIRNINVYNEGTLEVIQLREDEQNISDGHILIFIKNNKLQYMHWWFPC